MTRKVWMALLLVLALTLGAFYLAGCAAEEPAEDGEETEEPAEEEGLAIDVVAQWTGSSHAKLIAFAAVEEDCVRCHDGGAFADQVTDPAALERDWSVSTDCRACHTGYGVEVAAAGVVDIPTMDGFEAGVGALCASCHNGRRVPDPAAERRSAPHHSVQSDVLTASGGMPLEGVTYSSNTAHATVTNACVACHFDESGDGPASHTLAPYFGACESGDCHGDPMNADVTARADYDGDGTVEGFQQEVQGLLDDVDAAITDELGGGKYVAGGGSIAFSDEASQTVAPSNELYAATYNRVMIEYDGSLGIHNPAFVVGLLQATYQSLTGEAHPGAPLTGN